MAELLEIPLRRGGRIVSSLAGAFGSALRETRLTAMLGYVIASKPAVFEKPFGFRGVVSGVSIEESVSDWKRGRCDVRIQTSHGDCVVEAKVNTIDPRHQCSGYPGRWRVLLTNHISSRQQRNWRAVRYVSWNEVGNILKDLVGQKNAAGFVSADLIKHLEKHNMIKKERAVEIYAREINEKTSLDLFLQAQVYRCWYKESSRLPEALYFAPHFGHNLSIQRPGIQVGVSYVARIETVEVVESWEEFRDAVRTVQGEKWFRNHKAVFEAIRWRDAKDRRSVVFLGKPRLVFNPPVKKQNIQTGSGWLSKTFLSFEELFTAWSGR